MAQYQPLAPAAYPMQIKLPTTYTSIGSDGIKSDRFLEIKFSSILEAPLSMPTQASTSGAMKRDASFLGISIL
jgi:hypothetical protein